MSDTLPTTSEALPAQTENSFFDTAIELFFDHFWIILTFALLGFALGIFQNWRHIPQYTSYGLLKIEKVNTGVDFLINEPLQYNPLSGDILELLTRKVLLNVVEALNLDITIQPKLYPFIGEAWVRDRENELQPVAQPLYLAHLRPYAWGGERYVLKSIKIPDYFDGKFFTIIADTETSFFVYNYLGQLLGKGVSGNAFSVEMPSINDTLLIEFAEFRARPGTVFYLFKDLKIQVAENLKKQIALREEVRGSNILRVSVTTKDPSLSKEIINSLINFYVLQSTKNKSEDIEQQLAFINTQLPGLRMALEKAEEKLTAYRKEKGIQMPSPEAKDLLNQYNAISLNLAELRLQSIDIEQRYTPQHPIRLQHSRKIVEVESLLRELDKKLEKLPVSDVELLRIERDIKVAAEIYLALLNKSQELRLVKAGILGNARILEYALPGIAQNPNFLRQVIIYAFIAAALSFAIVFLLSLLKKKIQEVDQLEQLSGKKVYTSIPKSKQQVAWSGLLKKTQKTTSKTENYILAATVPQDQAIEALRSLRSTLYFARANARNNQICILSPTPGMGKSFISVNLSFLIAETENKVLLIDTDLRNGSIHRYLQNKREPGLSNLIAGTHDFKTVKRSINNFFDYIPSGSIPPNPAELLLHPRFEKLLQSLSASYSYIIVDTAPIINVADALPVAKNAATNLVVVRSDISHIEDVKVALAKLFKNDIEISGFLLNDIDISKSRYRYGKYRNYGRYYKSYKKT